MRLYGLLSSCSCCWFFFFKQKTAYEMRISDWSSDVCSSDLRDHPLRQSAPCAAARQGRAARGEHRQLRAERGRRRSRGRLVARRAGRLARHRRGAGGAPLLRSEEHTSELQSLMRISYAVFCLKKKKTNITINHIINTTCTY